MPFPPLDDHGLLPGGVHQGSLEEVQARFVTNPHRATLWHGLTSFLSWVHSHDMAYPIYIAGGFISGKDTPNDIDIVHDLTHACGYNQYRGVQWFTQYRASIHAGHRVDYTVNLPGINDFAGYFQYLGPKAAAQTGLDIKHPRGVIRIESRTWLDGLNR